MTILHFYLPEVQFTQQTDVRKKIKKLSSIGDIEILAVEHCYNVEILKEISSPDLQKLKWILSDPLFEDGIVCSTTTLNADTTDKLLIEIGPRLNFSTPFSSNAVSVSHSVGLTSVKRIEKSTRYLVRVGSKLGEKTVPQLKLEITDTLHDQMTECPYENPVDSFDHGIKPKPWYFVDVLNDGAKALEKINADLGLSFDEWDIQFYTSLFQQLKRNPTSVECFDLAQSNSEHSRHWFFKGDLKIDGVKMPSSLFAMVMETPKYSNPNNVIRFSDNSSAIRGFSVKKIQPENPTKPSKFLFPNAHLHLTFTAETHNFPTAVSPFSGATTGTGGRIRDVQAVGRGGHTIAGTAGYSVGSLFIPGYRLPWEDYEVASLSTFAQPLEILIEASNGCSDYGNKFGEPVISGFTRSFSQANSQNERIGYIKPILFSGGIGTVEDEFILKRKPAKGMMVVKIGGPVYRIGVGGGSASSTEVQGDNKTELDFNAVQRGDAEMEQKLNRLVRGCLEYPGLQNPILSIHDQGAGGNGNVLKELVEPEGAVIFTRAFELGDDSVSTLDLWGAEYQESNAILCLENDIPKLKALSQRERCPVNVVGTVTGTGKVILTEEEINHRKYLDADITDATYPVNLDLQAVLGNVPKKEFDLISTPIIHRTFHMPTHQTIMSMLKLVLQHPTVCSKRFLTNKVDRSVTGLIAQQQCVGPSHTPVADMAITAISHFDISGIASSIGEQPIKGLLDPAAGARMSVAEALSNLVFAKISSLKDVKCSGNWMWPAKLAGEGVHLYNACEAMCSIMKELGIAVDGGKDSLSMATRLTHGEIVKSPGTLVISTYAPCPDITKKVTPDLKVPWHRRGRLLYVDISDGKSRLAGSILAQCYGQLGQNVPDIENPGTLKTAFCVTQQLIDAKKIVSGHDVSDGGLITCLIEMAIAGVAGICVDFVSTSESKSAAEVLFSEECGWVLECEELDADDIINLFKLSGVSCTLIGHSDSCGVDAKIDISYGGEQIICEPLSKVIALWEETSYQIEKLQTNSDCATQEYQSLIELIKPSYQYTLELCPKQPLVKTDIRVAVLREEGINGDREMAAALFMAGFEVWDVTMQDLLDEKISLDKFQGVIFPGGFSYADVFGAAKGWAATILYHENLRKQFKSFYHRDDTFSFGVCNGCQLMCLINWIGNEDTVNEEDLTPRVMLKQNLSSRFESRFSTVKICKSPAIMLKNMENSSLGVWVAHGEGRFTYASDDIRNYIEKSNCIAIRYVDDDNNFTERYPFNPNGSAGGVAGICSPNGRHLAMMPHPERCVKFWQWPYIPPAWKKKVNSSDPNSQSPWFQIFSNAYDWCRNAVNN